MKNETNKRRNDRSIGTAPSELMALEPRIMLDAAAVAAATVAVETAAPAATTTLGIPHHHHVEHIADPAPSVDAGNTNHPADHHNLLHLAPITHHGKNAGTAPELVFVDGSIGQNQALINDIISQAQNASGDPRLVTIIQIQPGADGIAQMTQIIDQYHNISAIHILSHNDSGNLTIGSIVLNNADISNYASTFHEWQSHLSKNADILVYGCNVAQGADGLHFVDTLASLTGADVAASTNSTGSSQFGGDWTLEYYTGTIETSSILSPNGTHEWSGLLAANVFAVETPSATTLVAGDTLTFTIQVVNNDATPYSITVEDLFTGTNFIAQTVTDPTGQVTVVNGSYSELFTLPGNGSTSTWTVTGITTVPISPESSWLATDTMTFTLEDSTTITNTITPANLIVFDKSANVVDALPGQLVHYVINVAGNATDVNITDALDPNLTLVPNTFNGNDTYTTVGNTELRVGLGATSTPSVVVNGSLFTNDGLGLGATLFYIPITATHGTLVVNNDGTFTYTPDPGFVGTDSFTYQALNSTSNLLNTATVTIQVNNMVWYVDGTAAPGGTGTSNNPFNTLAPFALPTRLDVAGDYIYVETPNNIPIVGGLTLLPGETLIGSGVALVVDSFTLNPAGNYAQISGLGTNLTMADNTLVEGFSFSTTTGINVSVDGANGVTIVNNQFTTAGGIGISGDNFSGLVIRDSEFTASSGTSISLSNFSSAVIVNDIFLGGPTSTNISLSNFTGTFSDPILIKDIIMTNPGNGIVASDTGLTGYINITDVVVNGVAQNNSGNAISLEAWGGSTLYFNVENLTLIASNSGSNILQNGVSLINKASTLNGNIHNSYFNYLDNSAVSLFSTNAANDIIAISSNLFRDTNFTANSAISVGDSSGAQLNLTIQYNSFSANYTSQFNIDLNSVSQSFIWVDSNDMYSFIEAGSSGNSESYLSYNNTPGMFLFLTVTNNYYTNLIFNPNAWSIYIDNYNTATSFAYFNNPGASYIAVPLNGTYNLSTPLPLTPSYPSLFHTISAVTSAPLDLSIPIVTQVALTPVVQEAIAYWQQQGISGAQLTQMQNATFDITSLANNLLGHISGNTIYLDDNAANHGWFMDPTPQNNTEFSTLLNGSTFNAIPTDPAYGKIDLLTVVIHEFGSLVGFPDTVYNSQQVALSADHIADGVRILPPQPPAALGASFTQQQLDNIIHAAIQLWTDAGITPAQITLLENAVVNIGTLPGTMIGQTVGNQITLSTDAGGQGWFVDNSPLNNSEFGNSLSPTDLTAAVNSSGGTGIDLLTALMHEMGHVLGLVDNAGGPTIMSTNLDIGERFLPSLSPDFSTLPSTDLNVIIPVLTTNGYIISYAAIIDPNISPLPNTVQNTAHLTADGGVSLNSNTVTVNVLEVLQVVKSTLDTSVLPGGQITYTLTVNNMGPLDTLGFNVYDIVDPYMTIITIDGNPAPAPVGDIVTVASGVNLLSGSSITYTIVASLASVVGTGVDSVSNQGEVSLFGHNTFSNTVLTPVDATPDLVVTKVLDNTINPYPSTTNPQPSSIVDYLITVTNVGNQDAVNIVLTDTFDTSGLTFLSQLNPIAGQTILIGPNTYQISFPSLNGGGGTVSTHLLFTVNNPEPINVNDITNSVVVHDDGINGADPTPLNNSRSITTDLEFGPDLSVSKIGLPAVVVPGDYITYTITVTNGPLGENPAIAPQIIDHISPFTHFIPSLNPGWSLVGTNVIYNAPNSIPVGGTFTVQLIVQVDAPLPLNETTLTNDVSVRDAALVGFEHTLQNNVFSAYTTVVMGNPEVFAPDPDYYFEEGLNVPLPGREFFNDGQIISIATLDSRSNLMGGHNIAYYDPAFGFWDMRAEDTRTATYDNSAAIQDIYISDIGQFFPGITPASDNLTLDQIIMQKINLMNEQLTIQPKGVDHDGSMPHNPAEHHNSEGSGSATPILLQPSAPAPEMPITPPAVSFHNLSSQIASVSHRFDMASASLAAALRDGVKS